MKQVGLLSLFALITFSCYAQSTWTWLKGRNKTPKYGVYGKQGVSDTANVPGFRTGESTWTDSLGNVWMFGGTGNARNTNGKLNDMWKFSKATNTWIWISGSESPNSFGNYGNKGISSSANQIRSRANAATWVDKAGNFWIYGGDGYDNFTVSIPFVYLDDLWKFEPATATWTWMGGDTTSKFKISYASVHGTKGVASATTYPGSKTRASSWMDNDGDHLWLFGGREPSITNALWNYSISTGLWTWVSGDPTGTSTGSYGVKGVAAPGNQPPPRWSATSWTNRNGDLVLFGGQVSGSNSTFKNDVWSYSPISGLWTWLAGTDPAFGFDTGNYGTIGVPSVSNRPGPRANAIKWQDQAGDTWIFGGTGAGYYNDVWKYVTSLSQWAWMQGPQGTATLPASYGTLGVVSSGNMPASTDNFSSWTDSTNRFYLRSSNQNWMFDPAKLQWAWLGGDTTPTVDNPITSPQVFGIRGKFDITNQPGARNFAQTWTDSSGNLWLFGGTTGRDQFTIDNPLFDFWKYSTSLNQWAWIGGDSLVNKPSVYGALGIPSDSSMPSGRSRAYTWTDKSGNLWMFSGSGNELWKYSVSLAMWTWMGGNASASNINYGMRGVPSTANYPPSRAGGGVNWVDKSGDNVWFFGGGGLLRGTNVYDDQVWRYNITTNVWTWFSGATNPLAAGPDRRTGSASWVDSSGEFWIFGGSDFISVDGEHNNYNSLRKFSPTTSSWTLVKGDPSARKKGVYGVKGIPASNNTPGARIFARSWSDGLGNLYLFGGSFDSLYYTGYDLPGYFNDVWKYNIASNQWVWIGGDSTLNHWGIYGTQGVASPTNQPGARYGASIWSNNSGNAWLFSGYGFADNGMRPLDDVMRFNPVTEVALPVTFSSFTADKKENTVALRWSTAQEFNTQSFSIERSADGINYTPIGSVSAHGNSPASSFYSFDDLDPFMSVNFYRIKEIDQDTRFIYSSARQVVFQMSNATFAILGNPVDSRLSLSIGIPFSQRTTIRISNPAGQIMLEKEYLIEKGNSKIDVNVASLSKGLYTISVFSQSINQSKTFLKK